MDLWSVIRADLTIADLIRPAEGFGPHCTVPAEFGCLVAGKDPVAVDATVCRMVGLDISKVKIFKSARERSFGNSDPRKIEIRGKKIEEVFKNLWLPYLGGLDRWPEYDIQDEGACSSCQGLLAFTMERLKAVGEYDKNKEISVLVGPKKSLPKKDPKDIILIGDCLKKWRGQGVYIAGCPPGERYAIWSIMNREDSEKVCRGRQGHGKRGGGVKTHHGIHKENQGGLQGVVPSPLPSWFCVCDGFHEIRDVSKRFQVVNHPRSFLNFFLLKDPLRAILKLR